MLRRRGAQGFPRPVRRRLGCQQTSLPDDRGLRLDATSLKKSRPVAEAEQIPAETNAHVADHKTRASRRAHQHSPC